MSPSTILPDRNTVDARRPQPGAGPEQLLTAIAQQLRSRSPETSASYADVAVDHPLGAFPVLIPGTAQAPSGGAVAAAVNDDASADMVVRYASTEAHRLDVPLRVVHVWTGSGVSATGARLLRHDRMDDADHLLATVIYETLPDADADIAEREILHDPEPVRALTALSAGLSLLVVAAAAARGRALGSIAGGLLGRTACPLVVVPAIEESAVW
jgi:universal stress protein family protein